MPRSSDDQSYLTTVDKYDQTGILISIKKTMIMVFVLDIVYNYLHQIYKIGYSNYTSIAGLGDNLCTPLVI